MIDESARAPQPAMPQQPAAPQRQQPAPSPPLSEAGKSEGESEGKSESMEDELAGGLVPLEPHLDDGTDLVEQRRNERRQRAWLDKRCPRFYENRSPPPTCPHGKPLTVDWILNEGQPAANFSSRCVDCLGYFSSPYARARLLWLR